MPNAVLTFLGGSKANEPSEDKPTATGKAKLHDSDFALPSKRKYPIVSDQSTLSCIRYFRFVPKEDREEVGKNLCNALKKFKLGTKDSPIKIYKGNPIVIYLELYEISYRLLEPTKKKSKKGVTKNGK